MSLLEICVDTIQSAVNAVAGGADRLEVCSALSEGGLTPSVGFVQTVKDILDVPIHVLIRPRPGDFEYSESDISIMEKDTRKFVELGVDGLVIGSLKGYEINKTVICYFMSVASGVPVTFNRAFDLCTNHLKALEDVIEMGCTRVLTSGFSRSAYEGRSQIKELVEKAGSRVIVMPGCGINSSNIEELKEVTKAEEYHSSARKPILGSNVETETPVVIGSVNCPHTSTFEVRALKTLLSNN